MKSGFLFTHICRVLAIGLLSLMFLVGCSASYGKKVMEASAAAPTSIGSRLLIKKARLKLEVANLSEASENIQVLVKNFGGVMLSVHSYDADSVYLDVSIPHDQLELVIANIIPLGTVKSQDISSEDVTEEMIDIDAKLKNLHVLRDRFRSLLNQAKKVDEILSIESELARIQTQIDQIEGRKKSLNSQITYSSLNISLEKKTIYGPLGYLTKGIYWGIKKLFILK